MNEAKMIILSGNASLTNLYFHGERERMMMTVITHQISSCLIWRLSRVSSSIQVTGESCFSHFVMILQSSSSKRIRKERGVVSGACVMSRNQITRDRGPSCYHGPSHGETMNVPGSVFETETRDPGDWKTKAVERVINLFGRFASLFLSSVVYVHCLTAFIARSSHCLSRRRRCWSFLEEISCKSERKSSRKFE